MCKKSRAARAHVAAGGRAYPPFTRARTVLGGRDVRHGSLPTAAGPLRRGKGRRGGGIDGGCGEAASCRSVGATARAAGSDDARRVVARVVAQAELGRRPREPAQRMRSPAAPLR